MTKYYRVKKDTVLWKKDAIISNEQHKDRYVAIEDIWDTTPVNDGEYISACIIEHETCSQFFERVYKDTLTGILYKTKDQLVEMYKTSFKK